MRNIFFCFVLLVFTGCGGSSGSGTAAGEIWQPEPGATWQIQLQGELNTSYDVQVYDIDLYDTPKAVIDDLHSRGVKVICYFSAGSYENWRSDASEFPEAVIGKDLDGWEGESWLDIRNTLTLMPIMDARMDIAAAKGCDAVDPDNVDGYANDTGFPLTASDQLIYNKMLADSAHERGLAVGLKNDIDQIDDLVDFFDFAVNEQCFYYDECGSLLPFINTNKAVFGIEYELEPDEFCDKSIVYGFSTLLMDQALDGDMYSCR
ncbi:TM1410 hypothetical-related protein [Denitrovibrio acetiphilus DSM 12809]|uniref:TM1410 hypothetical-related protein n=1 Tax=Denitrovibrio acetiphilus (strain DSM 12809 / NBRC 114555 / N2460) TaxID=522772 RepID=D4H7N2_DENA2|nr:endo alpha-1,4 polygalactosaminidase [Denitrovibrio acetiphilus]ADD68031.1 TM1410 hypothetical-related protein [Denitrovibrio acetiphilus DSM 12809]